MQSGIKPDSNRKFEVIGKLTNIILPLLTCIAVVFYISSVLSYELVIGASLDNSPVGYVSSASAFVQAKLELEDEVTELSNGSQNADIDISYDFKFVKDPEYLTASQCYDILWDHINNDFVMAYMLYVDDRQAAAHESGEELEELLAQIKADMLESGNDKFNEVRIENSLRIERQLCQKNMLRTLDQVDALLNPLAKSQKTGQSAKTTNDDAQPIILRVNAFTTEAETSVAQSELYNPDIDYGVNRSVATGDVGGLMLDYNFVNTVSQSETIYYKTQYINDYDTFVGTDKEVTAGSNGSKIVTYDLSYDTDGNLIGRTVVDEEIIIPATDRVVMVGAKPIPDPVPTGTFIWPCATPKGISSGYGWRTVYGKTEFHLGIDLPDEKNSPIYASDGGEVVWAGYTPSYGYSIRIKHADDYYTLYAHLNKMLVSIGDHVYQGQQIGKMGNTGLSYGSHLHFEVRIGSQTYDPLKYLPKRD